MSERAAAVLKEIEALASVEFLPIIGPVKGKYLVDTLKRVKANSVLEVGTLVGYSAILMAQSSVGWHGAHHRNRPEPGPSGAAQH
jgi:predicted O-methyltransferase YrrM